LDYHLNRVYHLSKIRVAYLLLQAQYMGDTKNTCATS
jgi:hypothetical protein